MLVNKKSRLQLTQRFERTSRFCL